MAKRCEHCRFWRDTVFKGESESGWGVWWGDCSNPKSPGAYDEHRHSLMLACDEFERRPEEKSEATP